MTSPSHPERLPSATARRMLLAGVVAGPFFLATGLIQAFARDGFDLRRHALSLLANGPGGWVQTMNFIVTGFLVIVAGLGVRGSLRRSRIAGWTLAVFGASMLVAAAFPADPMDGFPPGTPEGIPEALSTAGTLHFIAGAAGFLALAVTGFVSGRAFWKQGERRMACYSHIAGATVLLGFMVGPALPTSAATIGIWIGVVVGFAWLATLAARLRRAAPTGVEQIALAERPLAVR